MPLLQWAGAGLQSDSLQWLPQIYPPSLKAVTATKGILGVLKSLRKYCQGNGGQVGVIQGRGFLLTSQVTDWDLQP